MYDSFEIQVALYDKSMIYNKVVFLSCQAAEGSYEKDAQGLLWVTKPKGIAILYLTAVIHNLHNEIRAAINTKKHNTIGDV